MRSPSSQQLNYRQIDHDVEPILRLIEQRGIKLDVEHLRQLDQEMGEQLEELQDKIYQLVGYQFNLDSPRQLAQIIYGQLHLGDSDLYIRKTKTHLSTSASELSKLKDLHPAIPLILEYREKNKLKNTYIEPLPKLVDKHYRLHTTYAIDTASGRLSSKNPNLQNIPVRSEDGRKIREAFIADRGKLLLAVDYSQIQLRIAAHFSADKTLIKAFEMGHDIHQSTAKIMGVDRSIAKTINFGLLFGQTAFGLSQALNIPQSQAQSFIDRYFGSFPQLAKWIETIKDQAYTKGYVETLFGKKRWLRELRVPQKSLQNFAGRVAINHPIQGTEAEIVKLAMIVLEQSLDPKQAIMIMQLHDELVFEIPDNNGSDRTIDKIRNLMENVISLKVALVTKASRGKNWAQLEAV